MKAVLKFYRFDAVDYQTTKFKKFNFSHECYHFPQPPDEMTKIILKIPEILKCRVTSHTHSKKKNLTPSHSYMTDHELLDTF